MVLLSTADPLKQSADLLKSSSFLLGETLYFYVPNIRLFDRLSDWSRFYRASPAVCSRAQRLVVWLCRIEAAAVFQCNYSLSVVAAAATGGYRPAPVDSRSVRGFSCWQRPARSTAVYTGPHSCIPSQRGKKNEKKWTQQPSSLFCFFVIYSEEQW